MGHRRITVLLAIAAFMLLAVRHPSIDVQILTHQASDLTPHRVQAAIDLGVMAISVLVTWTGQNLR